MSCRTAATAKFSTERVGCQKPRVLNPSRNKRRQVLPTIRSGLAFTLQVFTRWRHQSEAAVHTSDMPFIQSYYQSDDRFATHLSTPKGCKAELAYSWLTCSGRFTHIKWSPVSCKSSAGHGKFAGDILTFYHCATQPTSSSWNW